MKRKCAYPYPNFWPKFSCESHLHFLLWMPIGRKSLKWLPEWLLKFSDLSLLCEYKILLSYHLRHGTDVSDWKKVLCMWLLVQQTWYKYNSQPLFNLFIWLFLYTYYSSIATTNSTLYCRKIQRFKLSLGVTSSWLNISNFSIVRIVATGCIRTNNFGVSFNIEKSWFRWHQRFRHNRIYFTFNFDNSIV